MSCREECSYWPSQHHPSLHVENRNTSLDLVGFTRDWKALDSLLISNASTCSAPAVNQRWRLMSNIPLNLACGGAIAPTHHKMRIKKTYKKWTPSTPAWIQTDSTPNERPPHIYAQVSCECTYYHDRPEQLSVPKKQNGGCEVNKGDAAYLWSARFSLPRRPPHQHSWTGNSQFVLSSLQQQNTRFTIKRNAGKLGNRRIFLILDPQLRQELQSVSGNPMLYLRGAPYSVVQREMGWKWGMKE